MWHCEPSGPPFRLYEREQLCLARHEASAAGPNRLGTKLNATILRESFTDLFHDKVDLEGAIGMSLEGLTTETQKGKLISCFFAQAENDEANAILPRPAKQWPVRNRKDVTPHPGVGSM